MKMDNMERIKNNIYDCFGLKNKFWDLSETTRTYRIGEKNNNKIFV